MSESFIGPIKTGSAFVFVSIQGTTPYILNGANYNDGIIYYWEANPSKAITGGKLPIFYASGNLNSLQLTDNTNGGYLAFRTDGITIGNSKTTSSNISMAQYDYANWAYPQIFLSLATYTLFNSSGVTGAVLTDNTAINPPILANNIMIVPGVYYYSCTSSTCKFDTSTKDAVTNWFCSLSTSYPICTNWTNVIGWTVLTDGLTGFEYPYCPVDTYCGSTGTCKGPCPKSTNDCKYTDTNYVCSFSASSALTSNWWTSIYFIIAVVIFAFFILIFLILLYYLIKHALHQGIPAKSPTEGFSSDYLTMEI